MAPSLPVADRGRSHAKALRPGRPRGRRASASSTQPPPAQSRRPVAGKTHGVVLRTVPVTSGAGWGAAAAIAPRSGGVQTTRSSNT